jgi:hypothetical protein
VLVRHPSKGRGVTGRSEAIDFFLDAGLRACAVEGGERFFDCRRNNPIFHDDPAGSSRAFIPLAAQIPINDAARGSTFYVPTEHNDL